MYNKTPIQILDATTPACSTGVRFQKYICNSFGDGTLQEKAAEDVLFAAQDLFACDFCSLSAYRHIGVPKPGENKPCSKRVTAADPTCY